MAILPSLIEQAKQSDLLCWLSTRFPHVRLSRNRRSLSVEGILRADIKPDGHWVACDWYGGAIGDSISVVRHVTGCSFTQAVEELTGESSTLRSIVMPLPPKRTRPRMPIPAAALQGRDYLLGRGISMTTIQEAERSGVLLHARGGVAFAGRDYSGEVRLLNLRLYQPLPPLEGKGKPLNKIDLEGSDKSYPVMLRGDGSGFAFVEGGVNVLAARDMLTRMGYPRSTVLATGGVGIRSFLIHQSIRQEIAEADQCWVFWEREHENGIPSSHKQAKTDPFRYKLIEEISLLRLGEIPVSLCPPEGCGDVADWNLSYHQLPACVPPSPFDYNLPPFPGSKPYP